MPTVGKPIPSESWVAKRGTLTVSSYMWTKEIEVPGRMAATWHDSRYSDSDPAPADRRRDALPDLHSCSDAALIASSRVWSASKPTTSSVTFTTDHESCPRPRT